MLRDTNEEHLINLFVYKLLNQNLIGKIECFHVSSGVKCIVMFI